MRVVDAVSRILGTLDSPFALIGGRAVAARGHPRMTLDFDFLTADERVLSARTWMPLVDGYGAIVDPRKGEIDDPVAGVVHIRFGESGEADVLLARWNWERSILERAEPLDIGGTLVPVPLTSDLIVLKLAAGGPIDLQDVVALVATDRDRWIGEVDQRVGEAGAEVTAVWQQLRPSL